MMGFTSAQAETYRGLLANDELVIETNDHVIIFVLQKKDISKIEKMFQVSVGFF